MTCGFLIQLVFCKKTIWFIGVEAEHETSAPPPKKILDPPLSRLAVFVSRASGIDSVVYSFAVYKGIEPARRDLERALSQYCTLFRLVVLLKEHCEFAMLITFLFFF